MIVLGSLLFFLVKAFALSLLVSLNLRWLAQGRRAFRNWRKSRENAR